MVDDKALQKPSKTEKYIGLFFGFLVFILFAYTIVFEVEISDNKIPILYTFIALMAGFFAATLPGFLNIDYSKKGLSIRAAGGLAAFILVLASLHEYGGSVGSIKDTKPPANAQMFMATSYCSIADVYGYGRHQNLQQAQELAIQNCINNNGVPNCCASNVQSSQE